MALTVPPSQNYRSPLISVSSVWQNENPPEGSRQISCEVDWKDYSARAVSFNIQNNATLTFSQIVALKVDNSECGGDVQFVFTDTLETIAIPALTPFAIVPVFTNSKSFYLVGENVNDSDITRFQILNVLPPPVVVPLSLAQEVANANLAEIDVGTTPLLPSNATGTMEGLFIYASITDAPIDFGFNVDIQDGGGNKFVVALNGKAGDSINSQLVNLLGMNVRFMGGLNLTITGIAPGAGSVLSVDVFYRQP